MHHLCFSDFVRAFESWQLLCCSVSDQLSIIPPFFIDRSIKLASSARAISGGIIEEGNIKGNLYVPEDDGGSVSEGTIASKVAIEVSI